MPEACSGEFRLHASSAFTRVAAARPWEVRNPTPARRFRLPFEESGSRSRRSTPIRRDRTGGAGADSARFDGPHPSPSGRPLELWQSRIRPRRWTFKIGGMKSFLQPGNPVSILPHGRTCGLPCGLPDLVLDLRTEPDRVPRVPHRVVVTTTILLGLGFPLARSSGGPWRSPPTRCGSRRPARERRKAPPSLPPGKADRAPHRDATQSIPQCNGAKRPLQIRCRPVCPVRPARRNGSDITIPRCRSAMRSTRRSGGERRRG